MNDSASRSGEGRRMALGIAAALTGALLWGLSGACAQIVLSDHGASPLFITAVRGVIAAVLLMAFALVRYRDTLASILRCQELRVRLLLFGVGLFLSQSTFAVSVSFTNAGTATVLQSLATVFVMAIACVVGRRLPRALEVAGLLCALGSTWLIATQGNPGTLALSPAGLGWGVANALSVALYIMVPQPLYARWPSIPVIACGLSVGAAVALVAFACECAFGVGAVLPALDAEGALVLVVGIGVLGTACAFGLYLFGVAIVGSVRGSLLGTAEPASAMVLTAFWLGTAVSLADWLGLGLMVAMILLVALAREPMRYA